MTSKERVLRTLEFRGPDRLPIDLWTLPGTIWKHGEQVKQLKEKYPTDFASIPGPIDHGTTPELFEVGEFTDDWGCGWRNLQAGIIGEVKNPPLADDEAIEGYKPPIQIFQDKWKEMEPELKKNIQAAREEGKFIIGGCVIVFERLQYLRGTENLYCDIALESEEFDALVEIIRSFYDVYLTHWLTMDVDAIAFNDDWGSQRAMLINPNAWRKLFLPIYEELIGRVKAAGKKVFFHSDGYIMDLYPEFIRLGVDAVNSQLWCMNPQEIAEKYAGKITFWGEISRQTTLPFGTPEEIYTCADTMKKLFYVQGGGLIGQSELGPDVPLENMRAAFSAWNRE